MKLNNWNRTVSHVGSNKKVCGWSYDGKTDFNTGRPLQTFSIYIYRKGFFRDHEDSVVVLVHEKFPVVKGKDIFKCYNSDKEAIKQAEKYIKKYEVRLSK